MHVYTVYLFTEAVTTALIGNTKKKNKPANLHWCTNLEWIRADTGSHFTFAYFVEHCSAHQIYLGLMATPKKQYQNYLTECTWKTVKQCLICLHHYRSMPKYQIHFGAMFFFTPPIYSMSYQSKESKILSIIPLNRLNFSLDRSQKQPNFMFFGYPTSVRWQVTKHIPKGSKLRAALRVSLSVLIPIAQVLGTSLLQKTWCLMNWFLLP